MTECKPRISIIFCKLNELVIFNIFDQIIHILEKKPDSKFLVVLTDPFDEYEIKNKKFDELRSKVEVITLGHIWKLYENASSDGQVLKSSKFDIDSISAHLPLVRSFSDILYSSYEYLSHFHSRKESLGKCSLNHEMAYRIFNFVSVLNQKFEVVGIAVSKEGWERKFFLACLLHCNSSVYSIVPSMIEDFQFVELIGKKCIKYCDSQMNSDIIIKEHKNSFVLKVNSSSFPNNYDGDHAEDLYSLKRKFEVKNNKNPTSLKTAIIIAIKWQIFCVKMVLGYFIDTYATWNKDRFDLSEYFKSLAPFTLKDAFAGLQDRLRLWWTGTLNRLAFIFLVLSPKKLSIGNREYSLVMMHYFPEANTLGEFVFAATEIELVKFYRQNSSGSMLVFVDHPQNFFMGERSFLWRKIYGRLHDAIYYPLLSSDGVSYSLISEAHSVHTIIGSVAFEASLLNVPVYLYSLHPILSVCSVKPGTIALSDVNRISAVQYLSYVRSKCFRRTNFLEGILGNV